MMRSRCSKMWTSDNTMSTSNQTRIPATSPEFGKPTTVLHVTEGLPAGFPDPAEVARIAGELFAALPGAPQTLAPAPFSGERVGHPIDLNPHGVLPSPTAPAAPLGVFAAVAPPLGGVPRFAENAAPTAAGNPIPPSTAPAVPGIGDLAEVPSSGSFQFLREARPIFTDPAALVPEASAAPALETGSQVSPFRSIYKDASLDSIPAFANSGDPAGLIGETAQPPSPSIPGSFGFLDSSSVPIFSFLEEGRSLFSNPPTVPGPVPAIPSGVFSAEDLRSPQLPGAISPAPDLREPALYDFLSQARPLGSVDTAPVVEPVVAPLDVPQKLNLSSYPFEVESIRRDFPILQERVNGHPLIWFDNAATTQKPQSVIDRLSYFYAHENSNVHRAAHELAARATDAYESAREKTRRFLNAGTVKEIIFVRGATEGINLIAQSWGRQNVHQDDEIVITWLEHHANIVPWQMLCSEKGARLRVAPVDDSGQVLLDEYEKLLGPKTRLVSITQVSNALGTVVPVKEMVE